MTYNIYNLYIRKSIQFLMCIYNMEHIQTKLRPHKLVGVGGIGCQSWHTRQTFHCKNWNVEIELK